MATKKPIDQPPIWGRLTPENVTHQALATVREFATGYGRTNLLADTMKQLTGKPVNRQMVGRWLNGTAMPNLGTGLTLLLACKHLEGRPLADGTAGSIAIELVPEKPKKSARPKPLSK